MVVDEMKYAEVLAKPMVNRKQTQLTKIGGN